MKHLGRKVYHLAGGLGLLKDKIVRIGHMSPTVTEAELDRVLLALGDCIAHTREA